MGFVDALKQIDAIKAGVASVISTVPVFASYFFPWLNPVIIEDVLLVTVVAAAVTGAASYAFSSRPRSGRNTWLCLLGLGIFFVCLFLLLALVSEILTVNPIFGRFAVRGLFILLLVGLATVAGWATAYFWRPAAAGRRKDEKS